MSKVYISRDEAIEAIEREFGDEANPDCIKAKEAVYSVKVADVAPVVHGHWIYLGGGLAKCSVCKWVVKDSYDQDNDDLFCRKCGSKMDESEDNCNE